MGSAELERIKQAALALSEEDREALALELTASIDHSNDPDCSAAWNEELIRRLDRLKEDPSQLRTIDETLERVGKRIEEVAKDKRRSNQGS